MWIHRGLFILYFGGVTPLYVHWESIPKEFLWTADAQATGQVHVFNEISTNTIIDFNTTNILITEGF